MVLHRPVETTRVTGHPVVEPNLSGINPLNAPDQKICGKSSNRISGFSLPSSVMRSAPFCASPTMVIHSSESKSFAGTVVENRMVIGNQHSDRRSFC